MRKILGCCLLFALVLGLTGCGGKVDEVKVLDLESELYTQEDYLAAADVVKANFLESDDRTLREIFYAGDEKVLKEQEYILGFGDYDEGIVLLSTFDVGESTGPLNPNSTYYDWGWYLARKDGGSWTVVTYGYG